MDDIRSRWENVRQNIEQACLTAGRDPRKVNVVAVTKYVDSDRTQEALDAGLTHIGESRVQDGVPKWETLGRRGTWHFIGHLQRNKVKAVVGRFSYLHSLDRFSLAKELSRRFQAAGETIRCFLQVNVSGEESKFGLKPEELPEFAREVAGLPGIRVEGLMTMAPYVEDPEEVRPVFRELKSLQKELKKLEHPRLTVPHLSMGMSRDYQVAVEEGATYLRLGSVLVGREK
ncbi:YggS family pyridoxal phosphate-dependent enzyme [Salinithrix halophila]|uniref:Pyridoxal phosphate homeostasis protein n=1 Tax=Salinithrix halophila TaxID=1485204 RepID=A0ABV8JD40_9BACL